jgi:NAD(P)H-hydrate epimerase
MAVLTPHAGELARLLHVDTTAVLERPWDMALHAARESGQFVVLKHGYTVIAAPTGQLAVAPRAMPELATAGTGDVLAGLIGGFLAQGISPWDAARLAVYTGAEAGRRLRLQRGTLSVVARDVIDEVPDVLRQLTESHIRSFSADSSDGQG